MKKRTSHNGKKAVINFTTSTFPGGLLTVFDSSLSGINTPRRLQKKRLRCAFTNQSHSIKFAAIGLSQLQKVRTIPNASIWELNSQCTGDGKVITPPHLSQHSKLLQHKRSTVFCPTLSGIVMEIILDRKV
jgi:hypothetical protein